MRGTILGVITIFRRHLASCKHRSKGRSYRSCQCPIAAEGRLHGKYIRKTLDLRSWEAAQKLVRDWESNRTESLTVEQAADKFTADNEARNLTDRMQRKYKTVVEDLKTEFGLVPIRSITVDDLRKIREKWKLASITEQKRIEMLRSFFKFCVDSGWTDKNPAKFLKLPVAKFSPTLPFSDDEMKKIIWAAETLREIHPKMSEGVEKKAKALVLLMRYSGIRITDAVNMQKSRITDGNLFLYQQKTKQPVYVPLPKIVLDALKECDEGREHYFLSGEGSVKTCVTDWQDKLSKVFDIAGVEGAHAHRFRDTFAVSLLLKGIPLQTVSVLLGHTSIKTTEKHYAPWVKSRQLELEKAVKATW